MSIRIKVNGCHIRFQIAGRRTHIAVHQNQKGEWICQWANPTAHGYSFEPSINNRRFKTRREAEEYKRSIYWQELNNLYAPGRVGVELPRKKKR